MDPHMIIGAGAEEPPASGGESVPPATPPAEAAPGGESSSEAFKPVFDSQLPKRLQTPEIYERLSKAGGPKLENLVDAYLGGLEKEEQVKGRLYIPGKDAKPEDWDPVWMALGRPETTEGYNLDRSGELAELPQVPGMDDFYKETFRKNNVPAAMAEALWKDLSSKTVELMKASKAQREASAAQGLREFEALAGNDAPLVRTQLEAVAVGFFGEEWWGAIKEARSLKTGKLLGNDAATLMKLAGIRKYLTNSQTLGSQAGLSGGTTPLDLVSQALGH